MEEKNRRICVFKKALREGECCTSARCTCCTSSHQTHLISDQTHCIRLISSQSQITALADRAAQRGCLMSQAHQAPPPLRRRPAGGTGGNPAAPPRVVLESLEPGKWGDTKCDLLSVHFQNSHPPPETWVPPALMLVICCRTGGLPSGIRAGTPHSARVFTSFLRGVVSLVRG